MRDMEKRRAWRRAQYQKQKDDPAFREKERLRSQKYWAERGEELKASRRSKRTADPEPFRKWQREHRAANREKDRAYNQAYRDKNREHVRAASRKAMREIRKTRPAYNAFCQARIRAKTLGRSFGLTKDWAEARWTGRCEVTGIWFVLSSEGPCALSPSLDRIDAARGYEPDNCRFVIWAFNRFKGADEDRLIFSIARAIAGRAPR